MEYELGEVKCIRKKLGLTQSQLAKRAGVSQSLIAKIESGRIDPTYSKIKQIFNSLKLLEEKEEIKIRDILSNKMIVVDPEDQVIKIIQKMKKYEISQLPVVQDCLPVGMVSETSLISKMIELDDPSQVGKLKAKDIMDECPPVIPITASHKVVANLLKFYSIVLVRENKRLKGVLTKADLINIIYTET